jgi:hypothetical protein
MTVDNVSDFEARQSDVADAPDLVVELIPFESLLGVDVSKDAVSLALADVEGLAVAGVDQPVDVPANLRRTSDGKDSIGTSAIMPRPSD